MIYTIYRKNDYLFFGDNHFIFSCRIHTKELNHIIWYKEKRNEEFAESDGLIIVNEKKNTMDICEIRDKITNICIDTILISKSYYMPVLKYRRYLKKRLHYFCKVRNLDERYFDIY